MTKNRFLLIEMCKGKFSCFKKKMTEVLSTEKNTYNKISKKIYRKTF